MDEEEMRQIMEAAGEDFDVQVALAQAFERNNQ